MSVCDTTGFLPICWIMNRPILSHPLRFETRQAQVDLPPASAAKFTLPIMMPHLDENSPVIAQKSPQMTGVYLEDSCYPFLLKIITRPFSRQAVLHREEYEKVNKMMNKILKLCLISLALIVLFLAGCASQPVQEKTKGGYITGASLNKTAGGSIDQFMIPVNKDGDLVGLSFQGSIIKGTLSLQLNDSAGKTFFEKQAGPGSLTFNETLRNLPSGKYNLRISWQGPVQASYNLAWEPNEIEPPKLTPVALIPGVGMLLVGIGYMVYVLAKKLGWKYMLFGALAWVVTVALKFAWAIPLNPPIYNALKSALPAGLSDVLIYIYIGSLTGFFEVLITWLVLRYTRLGKAPFAPALAFGLGFGAIEAILLGSSPLVAVITAMTTPQALPFSTLKQLAAANNLFIALAPVIERFFTVLLHACANVLIFYAVAKQESRWMWLAFLYKTAIDSIAAYAQLSGNLASTAFLWSIEVIVVLFGFLGWFGIRRIKTRYPQREPTPYA
jgi:uncharacterized membrane protein YhfC